MRYKRADALDEDIDVQAERQRLEVPSGRNKDLIQVRNLSKVVQNLYLNEFKIDLKVDAGVSNKAEPEAGCSAKPELWHEPRGVLWTAWSERRGVFRCISVTIVVAKCAIS